MVSYSSMYHKEDEAHRKTRADLKRANDLIQTFREFLRLKDMRQDFLEWLLAKHLGEQEAKEFLAKIEAEDVGST